MSSQAFQQDHYFDAANQAVNRLLNLLDRNPVSPTFGCFDRSYWLHRKTDFAVSTAQLSVYSLALFYGTAFKGNPLYQNKTALSWIEGALRFTLSLQHSDGSFDEWYPNERGWAGPTGYVAQAILSALELLEGELSPSLQQAADQCLLRAAAHLAKRDEGEILANHFAIALAPLAAIAERSGCPKLRRSAEEWMGKFKRLVSREGWSLEYDGCDIGYNLGTLSFLAEIHRRTEDPSLLEYARKSFFFLSHFAYPDGSWAGPFGSRHTSHSYPYALEYWAGKIAEAHPMLKHQRASLAQGVSLLPGDQEDHYLHYRLAEYIKAGLAFYSGAMEEEALPYEKPDFASAHFPEAGLRLQKISAEGKELMLWMAERRGGPIRVYDLEKKALLLANAGCLFHCPGGEVLTNLWQSEGAKSSVQDAEIKTEIRLHRQFTRRFTPLSFVLFRICCLFLFFPGAAYWFKLRIRKKMITNKNTALSVWRRSLQWTPQYLLLRDEVEWNEPKLWSRLFHGGEFHIRYVPQAQYFSAAELAFSPHEFSPTDFSDPNRPVVEQRLDFKTGGLEICAR